jgi:Mor family transcriptional regulator
MLKLAAKFQGTGMYFPKLDSLIQEARNKRIRAEFNGGNHKELAIKYNITEVWVRNILAQRDNPNQMSIFQFTGTAT